MRITKKGVFISGYIWLASWVCQAQNGSYGVTDLERKIDSLISVRMSSDHIPGVAFILIKDGKILLKKGYGYARLGATKQAVDPDSTIFRIGSITKTFTATALLQLIDQKKVGLHRDVNTYLKSIQIPATFDKPVTPFHLLSHSAGFDELGKGRVVFDKTELIPLATFLKGRLVRVRPAGIVPAYSTYGIAVAGLLVEELSKLPLELYFKKNIWQPLGMTMTCLEIPAHLQSYVALGYEYENGTNIAQPWEWYHTFPASSINSTVADMGKYMQMHLNGGIFDKNVMLSAELAAKMQTQQISVHPKVDGFGLGYYAKKWPGATTFDHGGDMLGFSSYMLLSQAENLGVFIVHHHENASLRRDVIAAIMQHFHPTWVNSVPQETSHVAVTASSFAGEYRWLSTCITCPDADKPRPSKLTANADGTLSGFGRTFIQIEPLLFKSTDGERTMGFRKNKAGRIQYMSLGNVNVFEKIEL